MITGSPVRLNRVFPFLLVALVLSVGCDDDDGSRSNQTAATPTATVTPQSTVTPTEPPGPPHSIMEVGSTELNGGALAVSDMPVAFVVASACLGGTGDECEGGTVVYTGTSPGFDTLEEDDPNAPIYQLPDGVEVTIELTAVDAGGSVLISGVQLDVVGESVVVNTTPHLHNHPTWQIIAPAGEPPPEKHLTFRLHAEGFDPSEEISLILVLFDEETDGHGHDD